ncbi:hypothetical protein [Streptomyces sp. bgisy153]|uniref:hypothetical protein n=1 Tax=Streptomyces sp. bgisy153 TaxID=3413793 RepID=UPI003D7255FE
MSEPTRDPLAELIAFESAAFRIGQVARRLLAEHPGLPVQTMEPTAWSLASSDGPDVHTELELRFDSVDEVRAWAEALGVEPTAEVSERSPYERAAVEATVDGVLVKVSGSRALTGDEYAAWRAKHQPAGGEGR